MKGFANSIWFSLIVLAIAISPVVVLFAVIVIAVLIVAVACDLFAAIRGSRNNLSPHRGYRDR